MQLREAVLKHKAEMEALAEEHSSDLAALTTARQAEAAAAARQAAEMEARLAEVQQKLAAAQVRVYVCVKPKPT